MSAEIDKMKDEVRRLSNAANQIRRQDRESLAGYNAITELNWVTASIGTLEIAEARVRGLTEYREDLLAKLDYCDEELMRVRGNLPAIREAIDHKLNALAISLNVRNEHAKGDSE